MLAVMARPVMRLQLRHRHDEVGLQKRGREPDRCERREAALERYFADIVVIQIHETDFEIGERLVESRPRQQIFHVATMARSLSDDDLARSCFQERLRAAATTCGCVLIAVLASYSTMFGLRNTRRPRTDAPRRSRPATRHR
jgi:hypothetical protein